MAVGSGDQFIPHLSILREQLTKPLREDHDRFVAWFNELQQLPRMLGLARYAIIELIRYQNAAVAALRSRRSGEASELQFFGLAPRLEEPIVHAVDAFFDASRRAQNAVSSYLRLKWDRNLPRSLNDVQKQIRKGTSNLPPPIQDLIVNYWNEGGGTLKDYRDLAQHHALVSSDCHVVFTPAGDEAIYLALPNNPEIKSAAKLSFDPPVHALSYAVAALEQLIEFAFALTKEMLDLPLPRERTLTMVFRPMVTAGMTAERVVDEGTFETEFNTFLSELQSAKGIE